jgi:hypothetical protein
MIHRFIYSCITHNTQVVFSITNVSSCENGLRVEPINQNQPSKEFYSRHAARFPGIPEDWVSLQGAMYEGVEPLGGEESAQAKEPTISTQGIEVHFQ